MTSLLYLVVTAFKNGILEVFKKPAKLIMYILVIGALIALIVISALTGARERDSVLDPFWLDGCFFLLLAMFAILSVQKGLSSGDAIFDMNDVNFLFVSPLSPRSILLYGIIRMIKMVFFGGFFLLFQTSTLSSVFGVGFDAIMLLMLGYMLAVTLTSILSLVIYTYTNGNNKRKLIVKLVTAAVFVPLVLVAATQFLATGDVLIALNTTLHSPVFAWTPVLGWAAHGTGAFIAGDIGTGLLFYGLLVGTSAILVASLLLSKSDYYEDVLVATETAFERKRAIAEGQMAAATETRRNVKVGQSGVGGWGASAILHKHLRESFRANRFGLFNLGSVLMIGGSAILSLFMKEIGTISVILQILMWMQVMMIGTGRGLKELYAHYVYLIPETSFAKIVWSNLEVVLRVFLESVCIFVISGVIVGESPVAIVAAIVVYTLFSLLLIGINYLSMRWTTADISGGVLIAFYFLAVIIIMLPGLVPAMIVGFTMDGSWGFVVGLAILAAWECIAAVICFALSKGVLDRCDMPVMPKQG